MKTWCQLFEEYEYGWENILSDSQTNLIGMACTNCAQIYFHSACQISDFKIFFQINLEIKYGQHSSLLWFLVHLLDIISWISTQTLLAQLEDHVELGVALGSSSRCADQSGQYMYKALGRSQTPYNLDSNSIMSNHL